MAGSIDTKEFRSPGLVLGVAVILAYAIMPAAGRADDLVRGLAVQLDGKAVVVGVGASSDFAVARYLVNGDLDPDFGGNGKITTDFGGGNDDARGVAIQPDGKIVVAGATSPATGTVLVALARYQADGQLDPAFGEGGKVIAKFAENRNGANAVLVQPDGKIVAAGASNLWSYDSNFALFRFNPDGSPDPAFGENGKVTTDFDGADDEVLDLSLLPDGKILVAGFAETSEDYSDVAIARYLPDGSLDPDFGTGGKITSDFGGGWDRINDLEVLPDGEILVGGDHYDANSFVSQGQILLARYLPDGSLDPDFTSGGRPHEDWGKHVKQVMPLSSGSIVAAVEVRDPLQGFRFGELIRYDADGAGEQVIGTLSNPPVNAALLADDSVLVAGTKFGFYSVGPDFFLARYLPDGSADDSFGENGSGWAIADFDRYQPDSLIARRRGNKLGDDVYDRTGNRQKLRIRGKMGEPSRFFALFQNDGTTIDLLKVRGTGKSRQFRVRYFQLNGNRRKAKLIPPAPVNYPDRRNVTAAVTSHGIELFGGYPPWLGAPKLEVRIRARKGRSATRTFRLVANSTMDRSKRDAVSGTVFFRR